MKHKITFKKDYIIDVSYDYSPMRKNTFDREETIVYDSGCREYSQLQREK